jgi:hypothetical protein
MNALVQQRCLHHAGREAVARCPQCQRFFCRECVSEHDDRILCAACLRQLLTPPPVRHRGNFRVLVTLAQSALAVALIWFFFFLVGKGLLAIPTSFHEGTLWEKFHSP